MKMPKYFICPMSKQIVDAVLLLNSENFGLLPTRRQIDFDGGYVNNWDTKKFTKYVKYKNPNIILERDHSGPNQGKIEDDGYESYTNDSNYFDVIHIDPWKLPNSKTNGIAHTFNILNYLHSINPKLKYEIFTEEAIFRIEDFELNSMLEFLSSNLKPEIFDNIEFAVIQSGVGLDLVNMKNIGHFNLERLNSMVSICKKFNKKTKEHNGDYLSNNELEIRFNNGVDSLNIGPEIAQIQTLTYLEYMTDVQINEFYKICFDSKKWEKWIKPDFDITNKKKLIQVCGHYCYNDYELPKIDDIIIEKITNKLKSLP